MRSIAFAVVFALGIGTDFLLNDRMAETMLPGDGVIRAVYDGSGRC